MAAYTKAVKQIAYYEVLSAGHYTANNQPKVIASIIKDTLQVS